MTFKGFVFHGENFQGENQNISFLIHFKNMLASFWKCFEIVLQLFENVSATFCDILENFWEYFHNIFKTFCNFSITFKNFLTFEKFLTTFLELEMPKACSLLAKSTSCGVSKDSQWLHEYSYDDRARKLQMSCLKHLNLSFKFEFQISSSIPKYVVWGV